jgi:hypothetical protein
MLRLNALSILYIEYMTPGNHKQHVKNILIKYLQPNPSVNKTTAGGQKTLNNTPIAIKITSNGSLTFCIPFNTLFVCLI